ncbi:MAG: ABC transporter ATP-binding protein [Acidobacteria bacterium]|nr:ABC transporter ATP-binding protein [Acidobacteriota bacterium]
MAPLLNIRSIAKRFGARHVLHDISLDVNPGEFLTVLGESGSGKTTLLRVIAGFEQPDAGEIWMAGERLDTLPPYRRRVNTVFQHYALFPHLSVFENVAYGLRVQGVAKSEVGSRVEKALGMVKMDSYVASAPSTLSGGQQQRVALARALVNRPRLLLLDEPLSALDANLRRQMQGELKTLQREVGIAFLFVTHDQDEAMALSDRIALLRAGALEQVASPREIYSRPATAYTAQFIGQANLLRAEIANGVARWGALAWPCDAAVGPADFSLRPEHIRFTAAPPADDSHTVCFCASIVRQIFCGATDLLEITCQSGHRLRARVPSRGVLEGEYRFEFSAADAVRLREGGER